MSEDVETQAEPEPEAPEAEAEKQPRNTAAMRRREAEWHRMPWRFRAAACSACGKVTEVAGRTRSMVRCLDCEKRNRPRKAAETEPEA